MDGAAPWRRPAAGGPCAAAEWLTDWADNGLLALNAFQGYFHMPRMGTKNIKRLLFAAGPLAGRHGPRGRTDRAGIVGSQLMVCW